MTLPNSNKICYVAFSESRIYSSFYRQVVRDLISEKGYISLSPADSDFELFDMSRTIFDHVVLAIKKSDLVIADISDGNPNVIYELGLAHAWGKPTIILCHERTYIPFDLSSLYPFIFYKDRREDAEFLRRSLSSRIDLLEKRKETIDPTTQRYINPKQTLSIQLLSKDLDIVEAHKFIGDILDFFHRNIDIQDFRLVESQSGSLKEIISASESSIARLIEKIIFFIPEWKLKNAQTVKVYAEANKINAETDQIRSQTKTDEALTMLKIMERSKKLGATRIVVGDKLLIDTNENGVIEISELKKNDDGK